jgi:hypothetical protein
MIAAALAAAALWTAPPAPATMPTIHHEPCPVTINAWQHSCYIEGPGWNDIYLARPADIGHELGHAYDRQHLNDGERRAIGRALELGDTWNPEQFADWYDGCTRPTAARDQFAPFRNGPFRNKQIARRCAMIARAY